MSFLLDTCVISELRKPTPDMGLIEWFNSCDDDMLYLCTVTLGELRYGIDLLSESRHKTELVTWYEQVCLSYAGHIIEVSLSAFKFWGSLRSTCQRSGIFLSMADGLIAATAIINGMTVVTRNTTDFQDLGVELLNPWS